MHDLDVRPVLFEVLGNQAAVTMMRFLLTAQQATTVHNLARRVLDVPRAHEIEKLPLIQGPITILSFFVSG